MHNVRSKGTINAHRAPIQLKSALCAMLWLGEFVSGGGAEVIMLSSKRGVLTRRRHFAQMKRRPRRTALKFVHDGKSLPMGEERQLGST